MARFPVYVPYTQVVVEDLGVTKSLLMVKKNQMGLFFKELVDPERYVKVTVYTSILVNGGDVSDAIANELFSPVERLSIAVKGPF